MNILFVLNIGFDQGGPSVHLLKDVIEQTLRQGHKCHVILKKTVENDTVGLETLIQQYDNLSFSQIWDIQKKKGGFIKRYINDCRYAIKCKRYYKKGIYDAVFLQSCNVGWVHMKYLSKLKAHTVFNVQDIFPQNLMFSGQLPLARITYPLFSKLQKLAYQKADRLITISADMKQTLVEQGVDKNRIDVVYNWSYADGKIRTADMPEEHIYNLNADGKTLNVVYAGNIGKMQNVELIASAAVLSKDDGDIRYYIIGDGANKKRVEAMVEGLPNVTVLPMQSSLYAESIYAQADVNLIPLAKGGIRTALPSKTATVLRTDSYAVFCIDAGSEFEQLVKGSSRIRIADNEDPTSLYQLLSALKDKPLDPAGDDEAFASLFSRKNAERYAEIIARQ